MTRTPILAVALAAVGVSLSGCFGHNRIPPATFVQAQRLSMDARIEGRLIRTTLKQNTGQPVTFTLTEDNSGARMAVEAPIGVAVPANITSAATVTVTGKYDAKRSLFVAESVATTVPSREDQPRS